MFTVYIDLSSYTPTCTHRHIYLTFHIEDGYKALRHTSGTFLEWLFAAKCFSRQPASSSTQAPAWLRGSGLDAGAGWGSAGASEAVNCQAAAGVLEELERE